ncbi:DinB family protein [Flammeovirgaceae bacterium SG7u.111]|nr:DinB family protein [Flammeovirgaceae bacterium SG7u.132]WPO37222.1 DinB family protein [Flammeovirgaceae bacterium SG7u.111]
MKNWTSQLDNTTQEFQQSFSALSGEELNWKPSPDTWSIAQNIDHLIVINQSYFSALSELRAGRYKLPFIAKFGFLVSYLGKFILNASKPDRKKKIKTFAIWEPANSQLPTDVLARFAAHQELLKREIEASAGLVAKGAVLCSPANQNIVYKLEAAFDIIVAHEQRHLAQAKEVLGLMKEEVV